MRLFSYRLSSWRPSEYLTTCNETCAAEGNVIFNHAMFSIAAMPNTSMWPIFRRSTTRWRHHLAATLSSISIRSGRKVPAKTTTQQHAARNGPPAPAFHQTYPVFANVGLSACCISQDALDALDAQNVQPQLRQQPLTLLFYPLHAGTIFRNRPEVRRQVRTPVFTPPCLSLPQARVRATKKGARMAYPL